VLPNQSLSELRLTVHQLAAVLLERPPICACRPQLLPLADELADSPSQPLDVRVVGLHYQQRVARTACRSHVERQTDFALRACWLPTVSLWKEG
jgi:hypothetical protein